MDESDHDLLIVIANDSKWIKDWAVKHEAQDIADRLIFKKTVEKAHERIDETNVRFNWLLLGGILTIILFGFSIFLTKGGT